MNESHHKLLPLQNKMRLINLVLAVRKIHMKREYLVRVSRDTSRERINIQRIRMTVYLQLY